MHKYKNQIHKQFKRFDARMSNILSVNLNPVRFPFMWSSAMTDNTISSFSFHIKTFVKYLARVATHKHAYVYTYCTDTPAHAHKSIVATISPKAIFIDKKKRHARNFFSCSITYMDCTVSKSKCGILPHSSTILCSRKRYKDRLGFPHIVHRHA